MATIWKSINKTETNNTFSGTLLSSWSRQQKMAMIASFVILGLLLAVSACSKQSPKPALVGVSTPPLASAPSSITDLAGISATPAANSTEGPTAQASAKTKKAPKKRPADVTYTDPSSGVSFMYPRKFAIASGDKAQPQFAEMDAVPMNFVRPGGVPVARVVLPTTLYPGTDFATGFFSVNLNRSLSEQECPHFAFVDTSDADGEPIDAQKVKVGLPNGLKEMEMTSEFEGNGTRQLETQYYHNYENRACYEYVLGLGTAGYGAKEVEPVNRDEVFARLEKILNTVKIQPVAHEEAAQVTQVSEEAVQEKVAQDKRAQDQPAEKAITTPSPEQ
jgi:hypothetical protein